MQIILTPYKVSYKTLTYAWNSLFRPMQKILCILNV
jgi:hypothetical protein